MSHGSRVQIRASNYAALERGGSSAGAGQRCGLLGLANRSATWALFGTSANVARAKRNPDGLEALTALLQANPRGVISHFATGLMLGPALLSHLTILYRRDPTHARITAGAMLGRLVGSELDVAAQLPARTRGEAHINWFWVASIAGTFVELVVHAEALALAAAVEDPRASIPERGRFEDDARALFQERWPGTPISACDITSGAASRDTMMRYVDVPRAGAADGQETPPLDFESFTLSEAYLDYMSGRSRAAWLLEVFEPERSAQRMDGDLDEN